MKKNNLAIEYAQKALKVNKKNGFAYCTLAEAYGLMGNEELFYQNVELAMQYGFPVWEQIDEPPYERYIKQERFRKLLQKYR